MNAPQAVCPAGGSDWPPSRSEARGRGDNGLRPVDSDGNEVTRTELPNSLKVSLCENCND